MKSFVGIFLLILLSSCKKDYDDLLVIDNEGVSDAVPVKVSEVDVINQSIPVYAIGRIGTADETRLSFKIGGIISTINTNEGKYVRKGAVLAKLRRTEIDAQVSKAQRVYDKSVRDLIRVNNMYRDSAATLENVQDLKTLSEIKLSDLEIAKFNQEYATIISPINGRVIRKMTEPNELVAPGQVIFSIAGNNGKAYVLKTGISDRDLSRVNLGDQTTVILDAFGEEEMQGYISKIAESSNPVTGTFDVEITVDSKNRRLRNGYIGRATITPKNKKEFVKIPTGALVEIDHNKATLFCIDSADIVKEIKVVPLYITSEYIYVKKADHPTLSPVIIEGATYLRNGAIVSVQ